MRSLVVAQDFPWPLRLGSHLRLAQLIEVLAAQGGTDLFAFIPARRLEPCVFPAGLENIRLKTVVRPPPSWSATNRLRWLTSSRLPLELAMEDPVPARREFEAWKADTYDVAWFSKATTFELLGRPHLAPTIVDLDDLEDEKIRTRMATENAARHSRGTAARVRRSVAHAQASLNATRWSRFQRSVATTVDRVALCSELDAERSQLPNVTVVPNGYQAPALPLGRTQVGDPPSLLLAGSFAYPPNADAAQFLVADIWPRIRERRPDTVLRLVGELSDSVAGLDQTPGVSLVGWVTTMDGELARADIVVVPLRYGSGTRLKILEAAAHRIPVVSTTIGAEGLGFEDGRHLLIADDAPTFAAACLRLMEDPPLRQRLTDEAEKAFLTDYQWLGVRQRITTLVRAVAHQSESSS